MPRWAAVVARPSARRSAGCRRRWRHPESDSTWSSTHRRRGSRRAGVARASVDQVVGQLAPPASTPSRHGARAAEQRPARAAVRVRVPVALARQPVLPAVGRGRLPHGEPVVVYELAATRSASSPATTPRCAASRCTRKARCSRAGRRLRRRRGRRAHLCRDPTRRAAAAPWRRRAAEGGVAALAFPSAATASSLGGAAAHARAAAGGTACASPPPPSPPSPSASRARPTAPAAARRSPPPARDR